MAIYVSASIWGDGPGRPGDNAYTLLDKKIDEDSIRLTFAGGEECEITNPKDVAVFDQVLIVGTADKIVWGFNYYGIPQTPETRITTEYTMIDPTHVRVRETGYHHQPERIIDVKKEDAFWAGSTDSWTGSTDKWTNKDVIDESIIQGWMDKCDVLGFIKTRKTAFLGSVDETGHPVIRAMLSPRKIEGDALWFSTNTSSDKVKQFRENHKACVYFYRRGLFRYQGVCIIGEMEVLTDQPTKDAIWRRGDKLFYKEGATDPDYCVLKFKCETARVYRDLKIETVSF